MPQKKTIRSTRKTASSIRAAKKPTRTTKSSRKRALRRPLFHPLHISLAALLLIIIGLGFVVAAFSKPDKGDAAACTVTDKLVNTCRPWFGAAVGGYNTGGKSQFQFFNMRLNNANSLTNTGMSVNNTYKMDFPHTYHSPGQNLFNSATRDALNDTSLYGHSSKPILINWKPGGNSWGATANGNSDASIRDAANSVKSLGSRKIMLALWHEPENNNVNANGLSITGNCKKPTGTNGSAAEYRAMWKRVRQIFDQQGVNNVVWVWNPMGWVGNDGKTGWACIENAMYPGDDIVDWIMWDPYSSDHGDFDGSIEDFYNFLTRNNDPSAGRNYLSKPWGLAEFGSNSDPAKAVGYWQEGIRVIGRNWSQNKFPNIKLYAVFDTSSNGGVNGGLRVGYNNMGNIDTAEQAAFNEFAKNILTFGDGSTSGGGGGGTPTPTKDTAPPTVTITSPTDNSKQRGTITVRGTASDNVKIGSVTLRVNDKWIATDDKAPYEFSLDTKKYTDGKHAMVLRAWDAAGNMGQSQTVVITIDNKPGSSGEQTKPPSTGSTVINSNTPSSKSKPIPVTGTLIVSPTVAGNSIQVYVNGKLQPNNIVDTNNLTNGTHTIRIVENGAATEKVIKVDNAWPIATFNHVKENHEGYLIASGSIVAIAFLWVGREYIIGVNWRERLVTARQRRVR